MGRERRRRTNRPTSRPATPGAVPGVTPEGGAEAAHPAAPVTRTAAAPIQVRSDRVLALESATMVSELKRVALVSSVCFGMLAVLVVVERLQ